MQANGANHLIQNHTHPFCERPEFSGIDDVSAIRLKQTLQQVNPKADIVQVVYGYGNGHAKARILEDGRFRHFEDIELVGPSGVVPYAGTKTASSSAIADAEIPDVEERNARAFGENGVKALHAVRILILGVGGLGSAMAYLLSRLGFQTITVYDYQRIEATNLNRFYFVAKPGNAVGKFKASVVSKSMRAFNRFGKFCAINANIYNETALTEAVKNADLIVTALDSDGPRCLAMSLAGRYGKPLVNVSNAIYLDAGRIKSSYASCQWFIPREHKYPCLRCQGALDEKQIEADLMSERLKLMRQKAGYVIGTQDSPNAQVIPVNSAAAGIAAWEISLWAAGIRQPKPWIHYDLMSHTCEMLQGVADPECTVCGLGKNSYLATGDADVVLADSSDTSWQMKGEASLLMA